MSPTIFSWQAQRFGKNGGEQIVGAHALDLRRNFLAALKTKQRKRAAGVPAPARGEKRRGEHGLFEHVAHGLRVREIGNVGEREAVLLAERDVEAVVGGGGLQFEIEGAAEALAQREAPGFVDAAAEGSVDHELHAAAFVEEALGDDRGLRGNGAEDCAAGDDVFDGLLGAGIVEAAFVFEPGDGGAHARGDFCCRVLRGTARDDCANLLAQFGDLRGKFGGAAGASPRQKGTLGAAPCASSTRTRPRLHAADAPGSVAEQHDVAGEAFDGEIFVDGADDGAFGLWRLRCRARFRESRRRW